MKTFNKSEFKRKSEKPSPPKGRVIQEGEVMSREKKAKIIETMQKN